MESLSMAFGASAFVLFMAVIPVGLSYGIDDRQSKAHRRWMIGLFLGAVICLFLAITSGGRDCLDYTVNDYASGHVPVACKEMK